MVHVFIVDDHKILAHSLLDYLNSKEGIECIGTAQSGEAAIEKIPGLSPQIVIMDIGMPKMDGIVCTEALLKILPSLKVIGLSTHTEISVVKKFFKAGGKAYLSKNAGLNEICEAIHKVHEGQRYIGPQIQEVYMADLSGETSTLNHGHTFIPDLTQREKEVLELVAEECTTDEIADKLFISKNTVQTHRKNLISKFGVRSSVGVVIKALEFQLI